MVRRLLTVTGMQARRIVFVVLATAVVWGVAMELHGRSAAPASERQVAARIAATRRPRASSTVVEAARDDDARALVAAMLLDGARHGWHAR